MKPLSAEQRRIMRAASDGRLRSNENGRWVIVGEGRPVRREREKLVSRGLLTHGTRGDGRTDFNRLVPTALSVGASREERQDG